MHWGTVLVGLRGVDHEARGYRRHRAERQRNSDLRLGHQKFSKPHSGGRRREGSCELAVRAGSAGSARLVEYRVTVSWMRGQLARANITPPICADDTMAAACESLTTGGVQHRGDPECHQGLNPNSRLGDLRLVDVVNSPNGRAHGGSAERRRRAGPFATTSSWPIRW